MVVADKSMCNLRISNVKVIWGAKLGGRLGEKVGGTKGINFSCSSSSSSTSISISYSYTSSSSRCVTYAC